MIRRAASIAGVLAALATTLAAQQTGAFVVRLGVDTLGVERYTRTATELRGEQVLRAPRGVHRIFTVTYRADGSVERFELVTHNIAGGPGPMETRATAEYGPDGVALRVPDGDSIASRSVVVPEPAAPWEINVYALTEDVLRRARASGRTEFAMPIVRLGSAEPDTATVRRLDAESLLADFGGIGPFRIRTDSAGTLLGLSGVGGTLGVTVERVPVLDIAAIGPALASRPLGVLSPADSVKVRIGRAELAVRYSRPTRRGRDIFGTVVPFDRVWRTGANSATLFATTADLVVGGAAVPAGEYSLYSIPAHNGWTLIVNRNTGQWGTSYDERYDLVRIPMSVAALPQPLEQFTIAIEPAAEGAVLSFAWDRTRALVPLVVR
jgi:hypothetical protein